MFILKVLFDIIIVTGIVAGIWWLAKEIKKLWGQEMACKKKGGKPKK